MKRLWLGLVLAGLAGAGNAYAQLTQSDAPLYARAKTVEILRNECKSLYVGDVIATQANAQLTTDKLTLLGSRQGGRDSECEADRVIAEANVLYTTPKLQIRGDRAEFDRTLDAITFTGDVVLKSSDGSLMRGTSLIYHLADEHARIAAGDDRVEMILKPSRPATRNFAGD